MATLNRLSKFGGIHASISCDVKANGREGIWCEWDGQGFGVAPLYVTLNLPFPIYSILFFTDFHNSPFSNGQ